MSYNRKQFDKKKQYKEKRQKNEYNHSSDRKIVRFLLKQQKSAA